MTAHFTESVVGGVGGLPGALPNFVTSSLISGGIEDKFFFGPRTCFAYQGKAYRYPKRFFLVHGGSVGVEIVHDRCRHQTRVR